MKFKLEYIRAKNVKNNAVINKDVSQKALLSAYQEEIKKLRQQLQDQGGNQIEELEKDMQEARLEKVKMAKILQLIIDVRLKCCLN